MSLVSVPATVTTAKEFVRRHHRHNAPPVQALFATAVAVDGLLVGVAVAERPKAKGLDDGWTIEVTRCATDGTRNACSKLYGAITRGAKALGWCDAITYTRDDDTETGASLRASNWTEEVRLPAREGWDCNARPRDNARYDPCPRIRWRLVLAPRPSWPVPVALPPEAPTPQLALALAESPL